jgi:hypothetical protein
MRKTHWHFGLEFLDCGVCRDLRSSNVMSLLRRESRHHPLIGPVPNQHPYHFVPGTTVNLRLPAFRVIHTTITAMHQTSLRLTMSPLNRKSRQRRPAIM